MPWRPRPSRAQVRESSKYPATIRGVCQADDLTTIPALCQVDSTKVADPDTGLSFASYTNDKGISYRVAQPGKPAKAPFTLVAQIVGPANLGWAGLAWGGSMTYNPLLIVWPNGKDIVVSSRMA